MVGAQRPARRSRADHTAYARAVLDVVARIPRGKVMSYGDVAEYLGDGGPRQVGAVMSKHGHEVPWHRVVLATGDPAPGHEHEALQRLRRDKTPMRGNRVDLASARWDGAEP